MSENQFQIIILFGRSGCGKGTQAKLIQEEFGFDCFGTGDMLRAKTKDDDEVGKAIKAVLEKGGRVPTDLVFGLWQENMKRIAQKQDIKGLIIDGSPRSAPEAVMMDKLFKELNWHDIKVFLLDISEKEAFNRLTKRRICQKCGNLIPWVGQSKDLLKCDKCGGELITRSDDTAEAAQARLDYFNKDVKPAIDYYEKQDRLININGSQTIEDVYEDIVKEIQ